MKKLIILLILFSGGFLHGFSQIVLKKSLSNRQTGYTIDAKLNPVEKTISGVMQAFWVNMSADPVPDVQLHLYLNAFRDRNSTFFKESGNLTFIPKEAGWIEINSIFSNENDLSDQLQFISPDDGNTGDKTVIKIDLPEPCLPGDTVKLNINFTSKLPHNIIRTGASGDFFFVAQWFPKFGVYEPPGSGDETGGWNCHQFHRNSEFYSNHSVYDVKINLPVEYVAGSGGLLLDEFVESDGTKTLHYRAEDIVDFAWTAWPGYKEVKDQWRGVNIILLIPSERKAQVNRQLQAVRNALEYFDDHVGPYPWPYVTVADPPSYGGGAGGMEYTTLFTSTSFYGVPASIHLPEMVTIHEFGHAYFMGIMASNEFEEPWLDEGVNTYFEERIMDHYYGENSGFVDLPLLKIPDRFTARSSYVNSANRQAVSNAEHSWNYPHGTYGMMSYHKASVVLETLEGIIGEEMMDEIFREYYKKWAFKHPSGKDFINVVSDVVNKSGKNIIDVNSFFNQTLYGTEICDYRVASFNSRKEYSLTEETDSALFMGDSLYKSVVELERVGGIILPVQVLIHFEDGKEIKEVWDGVSRTRDYNYSGTSGIQWVKIDPEYKIRMDVNFRNNSLTNDPDRIPVRRFTNKLIAFLQFFVSLISL